MAFRLSIDEVKQYFLDQNCELLQDHYINSHEPLCYRCSCGNKAVTNLNRFKSGKRCGCGNKKRAEARKPDIAYVRGIFEESKCCLLEDAYIDSHTKMRYLCACGEEAATSWVNFRRGQRCKKCRYRKTREAMALSIDEVKQYFLDQGCELIEDHYVNARTKMRYICNCGQQSEIVFDSFKRGNRCQDCGNKKISERLIANQRDMKGEKHPRWINDRELKAINDLFYNRCRSILRNYLSSIKASKKHRTCDMLGYSPGDLKNHIQSFATWNSIKDQNWHVDHIFPIKAFVDYGLTNPCLVNCLENLQPLLGKDNISKHAKYDPECFEKWLQDRGVEFTSKLRV